MPEIRNYTVTETREVKVVANSPADASRIAAAMFESGQDRGRGGMFGYVQGEIRVVGLHAEERR